MSTWSALGVVDASVNLVRLRLAESASPADLEVVLVGLSSEAGSLWVQQGALSLTGLIPAGRTDSLHSLAHSVRAVGVSASFELGDPVRFKVALEQAERAHLSGAGVVHFDRLSGRGFSSLVDAGAAASWASEYLAGISSSPESPELLATVRAWLAHHGQVDAAATELGVHRHTVRHRLRRAEALLEGSLEDPAVRADLWFAVNALSE